MTHRFCGDFGADIAFSDLSPEDAMIPGDFKWVGGTTLPVEK
jgi:hypothetical protein